MSLYIAGSHTNSRLRILSHSNELFRDRREAGQLLAEELLELRGKNAVVLGIPRGGIVVAREIAHALEGEVDIVLARKLRTPGHPELAMGAIGEGGVVYLNENVIHDLGIDRAAIEREKDNQLEEIARRAAFIRPLLPKVPLKGKIAIITDDGVATGATAKVAIWAVRQEKPARLVLALPVGSDETVRRLAEDTDETICLRTPPFFAAVGQFYHRFEQIDDEEVLAILKEERQRKTANEPGIPR